ncbi:MAG: thioredoxin family protein [Thermoguttaceae bacterium]|nr:thioredoxin family protein [Thermoguttaceae bacterium]
MKRIFAVLTVLFLSAASFAQQTDFLPDNPFDGGFNGFSGGAESGFNLGSDIGFGSKSARETVSVTGKFIQDANSPSTGKLLLEAIVPEGFHMYSITQKAGGPYTAKITLDPSAQYSASGPFTAQTQPQIQKVEYYDVPIEEHRGTVIWTAPIQFASGVDPSTIEIKGSLSYQICDDVNGTCLEPTDAPFTAKIVPGSSAAITPADASEIPAPKLSDPRVQQPDVPAESPDVAQPSGASAGLGGYSTQQLINWSIMAFLGGLILNVMPCVLPVISLKLMAFIDQAGESRIRVFILNLWYVAGLMAVFVFLAFLSTYGLSLFTGKFTSDAGMGWGEMYAYTWVQIAMCAFIFVMALSMLGVWEIPIPGFLGSGAINDVQQKEGAIGAFTKGIFTTLMAVPCTGPFIGPILGLTMGAPLSFTMLIFCMIGLGMGFPYILVGIFPGLLSFLPKPGQWMVTVREIMGFLLLGTTVYFFRMVPTELMVPVLTLLFSLWFICWIVNKIPYGATFGQRLLNWSIGILIATISTGWMFHAYTADNSFPWSDTFYSDTKSNGGNPLLIAAEKERLAGRTVMIEFTASWCPNCKANLYTAIETDDVEEFIRKNNVCAMIGDWSRKPQNSEDPDVIKQALNFFGRQSIPMLAILPADGRDPILLDGPITKGQLLKALNDAQSAPKQINDEVKGAYHGIE